MHISKVFPLKKKCLKSYFLLVCKICTNNFRTPCIYTYILSCKHKLDIAIHCYSDHRVISQKYREHVCLPVKRIFPAVKLRPQTPPIDKRKIRDAAIPGKRRMHTSSSALQIFTFHGPNIYIFNIYCILSSRAASAH